ncbi:Crp/Fnr family transcriptional regulator [Algoriphagus zhangzhouensis]|uniref:cAMP-binding domain of CRP or a regulatory subunit of cAMP-dependent protein kinases n=1 Tax=Algoriphagus zhangzhouensis TaxID=1073327 RepID=A0A1M7ZEN1_9BACT|nr:Crp/Fnr family transcriptional regulator [Algoriphagus zhangzhouensis]TDY46058.1 CRP-like cAMP-binding protein [Algoriphagus zhangzhouensis]SHO63302.1 cAMP-binding domain of CRP or a regulatory subunit of cAMP-dependent protein kinases [Algoriphagus zhangzhouensis]
MERLQKKSPYLTTNDLLELSGFAEVVQYSKGEIIIDYGRYCPYFFHVLNGVVRGSQYTANVDEHNLFFIHDDQWFITPEKLLSKETKPSSHIFEAVSDVTLIKIDHEKLLKSATQNPHLFEFYHDAILVIMTSFLERIKLLTIENAEERYKNLVATRPLLFPHVQKKHLAQFLGITPNSFSRILKKLKE